MGFSSLQKMVFFDILISILGPPPPFSKSHEIVPGGAIAVSLTAASSFIDRFKSILLKVLPIDSSSALQRKYQLKFWNFEFKIPHPSFSKSTKLFLGGAIAVSLTVPGP